MRLYDSMAQEKREFVPRDGDHVTMYFCGPTVYNYVHVGNARPYVVSMVARRYFQSLGWRVTLVENITDIDDRIIQKGIAEGRSAREVRGSSLTPIASTRPSGSGPSDVEPLATETFDEIIHLIEDLVRQGHAYASGPDVYFDVDSYRRTASFEAAGGRDATRCRIDPGKTRPIRSTLPCERRQAGEPAWDSPWARDGLDGTSSARP
jgi:cysteinyl-tRNA synthetase